MLRVVVLSVPHTGTRFAKRLLEQRCRVRPVHVTDADDVIRSHVDNADLVVCPTRNPDACWRGWLKRRHGDDQEFAAAWQSLQAWSDDLSPHWLPVDVPGREAYRQQLECAVGSTLPTDWRPVGAQPDIPGHHPCPRSVYELPVVQQFYRLAEVGVPA